MSTTADATSDTTLQTLLHLAGLTPPPDRAEALTAAMQDLRSLAALIRQAAPTAEPAHTLKADPLG